MRSTHLPEIRALKLFKSMEEDTFEAMMLAAFYQQFPARVELIREGDNADFLYVVVEGCVELYARSNGRESTTTLVHPVNAFILAAVLKDAVYLMSGRTLQRSKVLMIPSENVRDALEQDVAFTRAIVDDLSGAYRTAIKDLKNLRLRSAVERLANQLLRLEKQQGSEGKIELPYDKRTLASMLAMTPENLARAFNTLKPYGVTVNGRYIVISDHDSLAVLAKPNPLIDDPLS